MGRNQNNLIAGLDIGSTTVKIVVGQTVEDASGTLDLQILGAVQTPSVGVSKGSINSIEDVVSVVSSGLEKIERIVGVPIENVWLGITGLHIMSQSNKGVVAVSKADNEITAEDVERALEAAKAISVPLNYQVLHVLPKNFCVDGQSGIKDPIGMTGMRLEVDTQIILSSNSQLDTLSKSVYRAGLDIKDVVLSILANAEATITDRQKDLGVAVLDIGGSTTSLAVFEEGDLLYNAILPIGSDHITNDIAIGLRTDIDMAEKVKVEFGDTRSDKISKRDQFDLADLGAGSSDVFKRQFLSQIIEARVEEILLKVDDELKKAKRSGLLPAGIVLTGGGAKLPGMVESVKKYLRLPATLGYPMDIMSVTEKINDLSFATAVGLVKWGSVMEGHGRGGHAWGGGRKKIGQASKQIKQWIKSLIP